MPDLGFNVQVLDQVIGTLVKNFDARGTLLLNNRRFAVLGAMGPDLLQYRPVSKNVANKLLGLANSGGKLNDLTNAEFQEVLLKPLGAAYSLLFSGLVVPLWPKLNKMTDFLNKMDAIAFDEDVVALLQMIPQAQSLQTDMSSLSSLQSSFAGLIKTLAQLVVLRPRIELNPSFVPPQDLAPLLILQKAPNPQPASDPKGNRLDEFLRWHRSGEFAQQLLAKAGNDPKKQAYAIGWLINVAASVTAEPMVNNITAGPRRTHWWRTRLVRNFIDSWTYGFYHGAPITMGGFMGDNPSVPYDAWPSLCVANMQNEFNIANLPGEPNQFDVPDAVKDMANGTVVGSALTDPDLTAIATLLFDTINTVYPNGNPPIALPLDVFATPSDGFTVDNIKEAFVGAYAVWWFLTSGRGPLGSNLIGPPPLTAQTPPSWISSPSSSGPTASQAGLNVPAAVCVLLLAIAAVLGILFFSILLGLVALLALIVIVQTALIDWQKVRDNLYWLRKTLLDAQNALRDGLVWAALAKPPPVLLGMIDTFGDTLPATDLTPPNQPTPPQFNVPATRGVPLLHTNRFGRKSGYPTQMDLRFQFQGAGVPDANFAICPYLPLTPNDALATDRETDNQSVATDDINPVPNLPYVYPNFFVNGAGLVNGGIQSQGLNTFPNSNNKLYGDAFSNAMALIASNANPLPNYNLDGDHGYAWHAWKPSGANAISLVNINVAIEN